MTDVLDPASKVEAAEEAAAGGDFPTAEQLLREAVALQEATLGSSHPDLAGTLNNLALACERTNNIAEAERLYRRAHAIAVESLGPRHPFVAISLKNLVDFCAAHEIPIWTPPAAARSDAATTSPSPAATAPPEITAQPEVTQPAARPAEADTRPAATRAEANTAEANTLAEDRQERVLVTRWPAPRMIALATLGVAVIAAVLFSMGWREMGSSGAPPPPSSTTPALTRSAQPDVAVEPKPDATPARVEPPEPRDRVERPEPRERSVAPQPVTVLNAQLCSALEKTGAPDWQCASANGDLQPGTYIFYTRLLTNADTTVEHRWYRDDRVHQVMRLRVTANTNNGFRTFSSNTISPERVGDWKVEVRAADGTVLQEAHFVIR